MNYDKRKALVSFVCVSQSLACLFQFHCFHLEATRAMSKHWKDFKKCYLKNMRHMVASMKMFAAVPRDT